MDAERGAGTVARPARKERRMNDKRMKNALENIARRGVPENTNLMPRIAAQLERKSPMTILRTRPFVVLTIALLALMVLSGAAYALGRTLGYIPGVGLVENNTGMRVLAEPVSVTRDGVTVTVSSVLVYQDRVELIYEIAGAPPEYYNSHDACGSYHPHGNFWSDADADLRLPDGTVIRRDYAGKYQSQNTFAMKPVYAAEVPADVTEMTMLLKCIPFTKIGTAPENWEVPLKFKYVPAGTVIGEPVLDVTPSSASSVSDNGITVTLDRVVPQDGKYLFYSSAVADDKQKPITRTFAASAYIVDATGQKVALTDMRPPSILDTEQNWELQPVSQLAYGPYTLTIDKIFAYYEANNASFDFDPGQNPQIGQTWQIDQTLKLGGVDVKVVSAKMVEKDLTSWGMSTNTTGIEFTFEAADEKTPINLDIMDNDAQHNLAGMVVPANDNFEPAAKVSIGLYYEKGIPTDKIPVAINKETVMISGHWELQWSAPEQTGAVLSKPNASGMTTELKRVVKLDDGYLFYIHIATPELSPQFRVIEPGNVSIIDSTGQKINLHLDAPQSFYARKDNLWQFSTKGKIAAGPLKLVVEKAKMYYSNFNFDYFASPSSDEIRQQLINEHSFIFDVGADPQVDQSWDLNQEFEVGEYKGIVKSVHAVIADPTLQPFPELRTDASINRGYEFTIESVDPAIQWNVSMSIGKPKGDSEFADCIGGMDGNAGTTTTHTVTCRGLSDNKLQVTIAEISVLLDEVWEVGWTLPAK
jgi:hypothetical protein